MVLDRERSIVQTKTFMAGSFWLFSGVIIVLNFSFPTFGTSVVNTYMAKAMHWNRRNSVWHSRCSA